MSAARVFPLLAILLCAGCAVRGPQTYRLTPQQRDLILVPPGAATPDAIGRFLMPALRWIPSCAPDGNAVAIQRRGKNIDVRVFRQPLSQEPAGWLNQWTARAESSGCLAAGAGLELARRILESAPLDPAKAYSLMHSDGVRQGYVDLGPENCLQVITPLTKDADADPVTSVGAPVVNGYHFALDVETSAGLVGVETAWYAFQPRPEGVGTAIVPVAVERKIGGKTGPAAAPVADRFPFAPKVAFYRMFYKTDPNNNGITEIVIGASTRAELDLDTKALTADSNLCRISDPAMCIVIPRRVGVNPFLRLTVNGAEVRLQPGVRVRNAIIESGGPRRVDDVLSQLRILKPYAGRLVPVEFDRTNPQIFDLQLLGGESISWR